MPTISVIVPVYKVEPYLRRCVDSILSQTYTDFELILVDDGSADGCSEICDAYLLQDERVRVIHQPNAGLSAARNNGIDYAFACSDSGWVTFIDSDDWIHIRYLETLYTTGISYSSDLIICDHIVTDDTTNHVVQNRGMYIESRSNACIRIFKNDCGKIYMPAWGKLINKELYRCLRFPVGRLNEDLFITPQLIHSAKRILKVDYDGYFYYLSSSSITRGKYTKKKLDEVDGAEDALNYLSNEGEMEASLEAKKWLLRVIIKHQEKCKIELNDSKTVKKLQKKYNRIFEKSKKEFPIEQNYEYWMGRYHPTKIYSGLVLHSFLVISYLKNYGIIETVRKIHNRLLFTKEKTTKNTIR